MVAVTRRLARNRDTRLLNLPDALISRVLELATDDDEPWESRCRLALVCKAFRDLWCCQAFAGRTLCLDFQAIRWRIVMSTGQRAARRRQLCAALARVAPSVRALTLRNQLCAREAGLALGPLLAPLAPHVQTLVAHDGLSAELLKALGGGAWAALRELAFLGCNPWADLEPGELAALQRQLAALPGVCAKVAKFECSCQGMPEGGEAFFQLLPALQSLELEDWASLDDAEAARSYAPLQGMRQLTKLTLNTVENLEAILPGLLTLTQVKELSLLGCFAAARQLTQLSCLTMLDTQAAVGLEDGADEAPEAAAAWQCSSLTELRWCGNLVLPAGEAPVRLPRLLALEIDEAWMSPGGLPAHLCTALASLTSLRLVGGRCPRLPEEISALQSLASLSIDSCELPAIPSTISCLQALTSLQLAHTGLGPTLPPWVFSLPVRRLWVAHNQLVRLVPPRSALRLGAEEYQQATAAWLGRLTHVCLAANWLREMPVALLEHGAALEELDLAHNRQLQISAKAQRLLGRMPRLRSLHLEKPYWLRLQDRFSPATLRAIAALERERPGLRINYQNCPGSVRMVGW